MDRLTGLSGGEAATERVSAERSLRAQTALQRCGVFHGLPAERLGALAAQCSLVRFPRRRQIYAQNEGASALFVLSSGRVRVVRNAGGDRALTVAYRGAGEIVGETAIVDRQTYQDGASATEQVEAVRIPLSAIEKLLETDPDFSSRMLRLMVERRLEAERRIEGLLSRTVESRVAEFLVDAASRYGIPDSRGLLIGVKYTHQEIADYVGSTRETVTLTLGELKRRGLLLFDHRRVVVTNLEALTKLG